MVRCLIPSLLDRCLAGVFKLRVPGHIDGTIRHFWSGEVADPGQIATDRQLFATLGKSGHRMAS